MTHNPFKPYALLPVLALAPLSAARAASLPTSGTGLSVSVDEKSGTYTVASQNPAWNFTGSVGSGLTNVRSNKGQDKLGGFHELSFKWKTDGPFQGAIREYDTRPLVRFTLTLPQAVTQIAQNFPAFTSFPQNLHTLSFRDDAMSPPSFHLENNGTPWFLFDDAANTAVLSAGSDFLVSKMQGDGKTLLASGFNAKLANFPAGFTHTSWLALGQGIQSTVHAWGSALTGLSGKPRTSDNADLMVKYLGYWTDNGAYYYYNYDPQKGYAGTIQAIADHYKEQRIPIKYMQLDSWWYQKTRVSPSGKMGGPKNAKLPEGTWNAYGGTLDYTASPDLFPQGLPAFQKQLGLPLIVHGRWIDPSSDYHKTYKISGVGSIDPRWWNDRADYLRSSGVVTYEQDWLNEIYKNSPDMINSLGVAAAFTDNMARATGERGQTLQYCMPLPRFFLQGSNYSNLTTIRTSGDRFERGKWNDFLYTSTLADALSIRPWTDVFLSTEAGNVTIATLSSGPVGVGDAIGAESRDALMRTCREDGVIVRPGAPLLPTDASLIADTSEGHRPLVSATYTDNGLRTAYVFACTRKGDSPDVSFVPASLGLKGKIYLMKSSDGTGKLVDASQAYTDTLRSPDWDLYVAAPLGQSGIAFLGDAGKIVGTGRQRIAAVRDTTGRLNATVLLSPSENSVTLTGYAVSAPKIKVTGGSAKPVAYDGATGRFQVEVSLDAGAQTKTIDGDPVVTLGVEFSTT